MAEVETVRGPVDVRYMGRVLMHVYPWDEDHRVVDAVAELKQCASRGIRTTLVDNSRRYFTGAQA